LKQRFFLKKFFFKIKNQNKFYNKIYFINTDQEKLEVNDICKKNNCTPIFFDNKSLAMEAIIASICFYCREQLKNCYCKIEIHKEE